MTRTACIVGLLAACVGAGCHSPHGRPPEGPGMSIDDMKAASDKIAQAIIKDLNRIIEKELVDPDSRAWVTFGIFENKSQRMPTLEFETVRERLKDKLQQSDLWRSNMKFVASRQLLIELNRREFGGDDDLMQTGARDNIDRPGKTHLYYLNGFAGGILREPREWYYLNFKLVRASDAAEIFTRSFENTYDIESRKGG